MAKSKFIYTKDKATPKIKKTTYKGKGKNAETYEEIEVTGLKTDEELKNAEEIIED